MATAGLVLAALAAWLLIAATASAAVTYYVGPTGNDLNACTASALPCLTIQGAVNKAAAGDTINVAAGTYNETVTIPVGLTGLNLKGAQAGVAAPGARTPAGPAESTINGGSANLVIRVNAPSVVIDGFSVTQPSVIGGAAVAIDVKNTGTSVVIQNNFIDNVRTTDASGTAEGIWLDGGPDSVQILGNQISNLQSPKSAQGILIGDSAAANSSDNVLIQGNTIKSITSNTRGAYGVQVNNQHGAANLKVQNNTFTTLNGGGWVHAVGLEANTSGVLVTGNSFSSLSSPASGGNPTSIAVWFESEDTSFPSGNVNQNNFNFTSATSPPVAGIAVDPALSGGPVDGTCNWWGNASGPGPVASGTGALVSAKVTYTPWLIAPAPGGACTGPATPTPSPTPMPTANPNAVGGFVDVVTGGSGSGSSMGLSWLLAGLVAITAVSGGGLWTLLRRRS